MHCCEILLKPQYENVIEYHIHWFLPATTKLKNTVLSLSLFRTSVHALPVPGDPALDGGPLRRGLQHERVQVVQHVGQHTCSGNMDDPIKNILG